MILKLIQILVSVFLIAVILLQAKGTGLGSAFGGSGQMYHSKRGVEKIVFYLTIILAVIFVLLSLVNLKL
ncbi:MAG: Preprotein translocase, SecG subunit [Candidatus Beckwithbacteria bacterium GW2011_GWB1_47_15]|uniref:Protein-export membrane protein SecG n=1 Tax=Candidatus Beckwithbacteria bacterium GW2011_GWB1_47_15 TaxID=1618371 RepID=A0A0G1RUK8_9BACT|nr:MAG: preprotein translocase subunit SecG, preprotein translocase subunit SecG [Candidatus Beckwithbacteria bacterium GW2011_GWC1_49_16]KKU35142.1 MAG: Preprotein translocase, SecG subunit [Candidatus Beckwithbacteria bacterium GW2011_GWA1_46_30]KKU60786.1 MAG: Preprotein translocase, SecG subunit [Candidatus Beckwithbacteria bacterium GW2011_GWB1_47_15]KKU71591.1 MAG: Preprotein translocase, SecG subunit [Candidatus Beckwithbacteria bacterium GW2011_GWA2_47_25]KKW03456.1 MAG: Preprotein tran